MTHFLHGIFLFSLTTAICAERPAAPPVNLEIEFQIVALPQAIARPLVKDLRDKAKAEAAHLELERLVTEKKARLAGWIATSGVSGQMTYAESIEEYRYPTEFTPPAVQFVPNYSSDKPVVPPPKVDVSMFAPAPADFEMRQLGVRLEVEPVVSADGRHIKTGVVPQHTVLTEMNKTTIERGDLGVKVTVEQPVFQSLKCNQVLTLDNGRPALLGVFKLPKSDEVEIFILRIDVKKPD